MRATLTQEIDRRLAGLLRDRARRRSWVARLLPPSWLEPLLAPRVRRLRTMLIALAAGLSLLLAAAIVYLATRS